MTLFEYVAVAASLVCSFAATRLLGGLADVLRPGRRYWVHAVWVLGSVFGISLAWWFFWSYREVEWNYLRFIGALLPLVIIYVLATILVPSDAGSVQSWEDHYYNVRARFFPLNAAFSATTVVNTWVLLGTPLQWSQVIPVAICALYVAGAIWAHPRLHAVIALVFVVANLFGITMFMRPGSWGAYG